VPPKLGLIALTLTTPLPSSSLGGMLMLMLMLPVARASRCKAQDSRIDPLQAIPPLCLAQPALSAATSSTDWVRPIGPDRIVPRLIIIFSAIAARQGCTVVVPFREEMAKRHLKVTGDLGRVVFIVRITSPRAEGSLLKMEYFYRSTISGIPSQLRPAFAIPTSSTTWSAETTPQSTLAQGRRETRPGGTD
jgi:DNA-binding transcriptional LysR family regulator